ncbi:MAG: calcium/sodium antiporter [Myxococcales bacterium]|nr:calcium/sodium antiporter [Myxococcales bacterium]
MSTVTVTLFFVGLLMLIGGADVLVRGASKIAARIGISPLVIGLTVVAFGTSAPELAVSVTSVVAPSSDGASDIALGNVIGSNLFNVLMILGVSAIVAPLAVERQLIRLDVPVLIVASVVCYLMALDGAVGRLDGLILAAGIVTYTFVLIRLARRQEGPSVDATAGDPAAGPSSWRDGIPFQVLLILIGLVTLVVGSNWLVDGAIAFARVLGVSELIIGLTVVAAGTSLPELATSIIAVARGERDIAVGNAIGSSIFNVLMVLGLTASLSPHPLPVSGSTLSFDLPVMVAVAVACLPSFITGKVVSRWEGLVFAGYYVAYTVYRVLAELKHASLDTFSAVMIWFALPLTAVAALAALFKEFRGKRRG